MKTPDISIIVPIYNSEKYLAQTIESIINQSIDNIEILLVNDGSTDSSLEICNKYANKDITMAAAIAFSDNIYAVKTNLFLGVEELPKITKKVGIKEELVGLPSLALGTGEINIIDFATGYATLASEGYRKDLYLIRKIEDKNGNVIYNKD